MQNRVVLIMVLLQFNAVLISNLPLKNTIGEMEDRNGHHNNRKNCRKKTKTVCYSENQQFSTGLSGTNTFKHLFYVLPESFHINDSG